MYNLTFKKTRIALLCFFALSFASCEPEFAPYIVSQATPIVYGIVNPLDSLYQVRLTKSFVGPASAYTYAQLPDSIYFPEAQVFLETYKNGSFLLQSTKLEKVQIHNREDGIFLNSPNYVYQTDFQKLSIRPEQFLDLGIPYKNTELVLRVIIPGISDTLVARSVLKTPPKIINPRANYKRVYFYGELPFQMEWTHTEKENYFELQVVVHYREILENKEREAVVDWVLSGIEYTESSVPGGTNSFYGYYMRPETFYSHLRAAIQVDSEVKGRLIKNVDFVILTSDETVHEYIRIGELADDYHGASYSNVSHGSGIFTNFNTTGVYGLRIGQRELDSLAYGRYTKHLNFKNWE